MKQRGNVGIAVPTEESTDAGNGVDAVSLGARLEAMGREVVRIENDSEVCPAEARLDFADWQLDIRRTLTLLGNRLGAVQGSGRRSHRAGRELDDLVGRVEQEFEEARARFGF